MIAAPFSENVMPRAIRVLGSASRGTRSIRPAGASLPLLIRRLTFDIRRSLAGLLGVEVGAVNVKAKTGEKVGHIGRAEAIACQVVVLIDKE